MSSYSPLASLGVWPVGLEPTSADAGMVTIQATTISWATFQRTLLMRSAEPTPMIAELTTWVVLTGPPNSDAPKMTVAEDRTR